MGFSFVNHPAIIGVPPWPWKPPFKCRERQLERMDNVRKGYSTFNWSPHVAPRTRFARSPETDVNCRWALKAPSYQSSQLTICFSNLFRNAYHFPTFSHLADLTGTMLQPDKEKGCPPAIPLILTRTLTRHRISILFPVVFCFGRGLEWIC